MGILNSGRRVMKMLIEKSYCIGQLYGEFKKIADPRRMKLIEQVKLTDIEKKKIDAFYEENYGKKVKYNWHKLYQSFTGKFDENYFPEFLFSSILEPKMNAVDYRYVLDDKLMLPLYCIGIPNTRTPRTYYTISNGICFDEHKQIIECNENVPIMDMSNSVIIKPVQDTSSGVGVRKISGIENIRAALLVAVKDNKSVIVQECICQNIKLSKLNPSSVNTFRVITYLWNGKVCHVPVTLRIGQGGSFLDNAHAGGMFVAVNDNGVLGDVAFTEFGDRYTEHPDTHFQFKGYELDFVPQIIDVSKKMHLNTPQIGIISWDITVDQNGTIVVIEANTRGQGIWLPQMAHGKGPFGENTSDILRYISHR